MKAFIRATGVADARRATGVADPGRATGVADARRATGVADPGRARAVEHAMDGPLATGLGVIAEHLGGRTRATFERIAKLDRERTRGEHVFDRLELLELIAAAHGLLCDPPSPIRKLRRLAAGPHPAAARIGALCEWLRACREQEVVYDLWRSLSPEPS